MGTGLQFLYQMGNALTIGDNPPLEVVEIPAGVLHPELHDGPGEVLP